MSMNRTRNITSKLFGDASLILVIIAVTLTAGYAVYTSNRYYPPYAVSQNPTRQTQSADGIYSDSVSDPSLSNDSMSQLQQGASLEQGSTSSPQDAGTSTPTDPTYCDQRYAECAYLAP